MVKAVSLRLINTFFALLASMVFVVASAGEVTAAPGFVYAHRLASPAGANQIYGFRLDSTTGALTLLPGFPIATGGFGGSSFAEYLAHKNGLLFAVNGNSLSVFQVNTGTGALTPAPFSPIALTGLPACVAASPTSNVVTVGSSTGLHSFVITSTSATVAAGSPFAIAGASAFSCAFSRDGNFFYTGGNIGSTIAGFAVNPSTAVLTPLPGSPFESGGIAPCRLRHRQRRPALRVAFFRQ